MIDIFNKIKKFTRSHLIYLYYNIIYFKRTSKNFKIKKGIYAIVHVDDHFKFDDGRYFYILCMYFNYAGFNLIVKTSWDDYQKKRLLLKQNYIFVRNCSTPVNTVVLIQPNTTNHIINLSYGFNILQTGQFDCIAPYPMFPSQYKLYTPVINRTELEKSNRTMKIFFAGNTNPISYPERRVNIYFNVMPRRKVIEFISKMGNTQKLQNDSGKVMLKELLYSKDHINEVIISEVRIKEDDWLKTLRKTNFFICPPGVDMPWCHNCVEAMSAGAIPILEYADLFYPHLENYKNCLTFKNCAELQMAIEIALAMEASEIENMRKNVLNYFNDYLSVNSIAKKIKTFSKSPQQELQVAIPFIPSEKEWSVLKGIRGC